MIVDKLRMLLERQNGTATVQDFANIGISRVMISKLVSRGDIIKVSCGVYVGCGYKFDKYLALQKRYPRIVFSHYTAAYLSGVIDVEPDCFYVTIKSSSSSLPKSLNKSVVCFYVKDDEYDIDRIMVNTPFGNKVVCYNGTRTKKDIQRSILRLKKLKHRIASLTVTENSI